MRFIAVSSLVFSSVMLLASSASPSQESCRSETLAVYQVTFQTFWDRDNFPRQYPEWRPPAQWSKLIGFSHNPSYRLFELGATASEAVKEFAETGETEAFDKQPKNEDEDRDSEGALFDSFAAPPVESGVGTSHAKLFVDGNHTLVSLMSKLVPSPDWFVGLDSLNLCENGHFVDTITIECDPLDAGTDNGLAFTSPNWPTTPAGLIFRVTNVYPAHPAGSFYYPDIDQLPTIAALTFKKEREYDLREEYRFDGDKVKHVKTSASSNSSKNSVQYNNYEIENSDADDEEEEKEEEVIDFVPADEDQDEEDDVDEEEDEILSNEIPDWPPRKRHSGSGNALRQASMRAFRNRNKGYHASTGPADFIKKRYRSEVLEKAQERVYGGKGNLYEKILAKYASGRSGRGGQRLGESLAKKLRKRKMRKLRRESKNKAGKHHNKHRPPRDCKTSEWSEWSDCSQTCGFGEAIRHRTVVKEAKRGGKACPPLREKKWCGSARNCHGRYFDW